MNINKNLSLIKQVARALLYLRNEESRPRLCLIVISIINTYKCAIYNTQREREKKIFWLLISAYNRRLTWSWQREGRWWRRRGPWRSGRRISCKRCRPANLQHTSASSTISDFFCCPSPLPLSSITPGLPWRFFACIKEIAKFAKLVFPESDNHGFSSFMFVWDFLGGVPFFEEKL